MNNGIYMTVKEEEPIHIIAEQIAVEKAISPTVSIEPTENGALITFHDINGDHTIELQNDISGGSDGFSPTLSVTTITGGHRLSITDVNGTQTVDIMDGTDGQDGVNGQDGQDGQDGVNGQDGSNGSDGFSPTLSVTTITGGHRLSITDVNGTQTVDIMDGTDGQDGVNGQDGQDGQDGVNGQDGSNGSDGFSPTLSVTTITGGHRLSITDVNGTQTVDIMDGTDGQDGSDGADGANGSSGECVDVTVTGATPVITAEHNHRYLCGEVSSISFTPSATGICEVLFTSGTTAAILTLPSTVKMPAWFDTTALDTETIYDISIADGIYGAVMSWAAT